MPRFVPESATVEPGGMWVDDDDFADFYLDDTSDPADFAREAELLAWEHQHWLASPDSRLDRVLACYGPPGSA
jgi:hypothetical protein